MATISERIHAALSGNAKAAEIAAVLAVARDEAERLGALRDATRAKALDPMASASDVKAARAALADGDFEAERLAVAADKLGDALREAQEREAEDARRKEYDAAKRERDALAKDLATVYPDAAAKIADLMRRMVASDARLAAANADRPAGAPWIADVENVVRSVDQSGATRYEGAFPSPVGRLVEKVVLPAIEPQALREGRNFWNRAR